MTSRLTRPLDRLQGTAARMTDLLPEVAHHHLARWLKHSQTHSDLDPALATLLAVRDWRGGKGKPAQDPIQGRVRFRREMHSIAGRPYPVGSVEQITLNLPHTSLQARLYRPTQAFSQDQPLPLLVFFHGGGFIVGDLDTHDQPCRLLCRHGQMYVLSVDYRLAPEHPFPAAYDDGMAALRFVQNGGLTDAMIDLSQIAIGGDSAGGNLAATISAALADGPHAPAAQLLIYPAIELYMQTDSKTRYSQGLFLSHDDVRDAYLSYNPDERHPPHDPRLCPMYATSHARLAKALVVTAALDVLRDEGEIYARTLRQAGTVCMMRRVAGQAHGFINIAPINRGAYHATVQLAVDFRLLLSGQIF